MVSKTRAYSREALRIAHLPPLRGGAPEAPGLRQNRRPPIAFLLT
jgi:hypothetical protein